jgi:hypothetical protein
MSESSEQIESKVIEFLRRVHAPNVPSQIAAQIHEDTEPTRIAVERLMKKGKLYTKTDTTFLRLTGEMTAFGLREDA